MAMLKIFWYCWSTMKHELMLLTVCLTINNSWFNLSPMRGGSLTRGPRRDDWQHQDSWGYYLPVFIHFLGYLPENEARRISQSQWYVCLRSSRREHRPKMMTVWRDECTNPLCMKFFKEYLGVKNIKFKNATLILFLFLFFFFHYIKVKISILMKQKLA